MQVYPIQQAKVQRPPLRAATLTRQRLISWLDTHITRRVVFVTAEAGYGKTTLLADYSRRTQHRMLWFRIDPDDANWVGFLNYLIAAGRQVDASFASRTLDQLAAVSTGSEDREAILSTFIAELSSLVGTTPTALVFDDYHLVDTVPDVHAIVRDLVARMPNSLSFVFLSRRAPDVAVARLRAAGQVAELDRQDLRFNLDETQRLFADAYQRDLDTETLRILAQRTEGWAASLHLVFAALRNRTRHEMHEFVSGLSGARGTLHDYLAEEVVADLQPELQRFLMRTSILKSVSVEDATLVAELDRDHVQGALSAAATLGLLGRGGSNEEGQHAYHPLVREFLEARLESEEGHEVVAELHRRMASTHESTNWRVAAYHYAAIKANFDLHRLLISHAPSIMGAGEFDLALSYMERLGETLSDPVFNLYTSRAELELGRQESAWAHASAAHAVLWRSQHPLRDLAAWNRVAVGYMLGQLNDTYQHATELAASDASADVVEMARATIVGLEASVDGGVDEYDRALASIEKRQRSSQNLHYLGITLLDRAIVAQSRGDAATALRISYEASQLISQAATVEASAALLTRAWALAHGGDWEGAVRQMSDAQRGSQGFDAVETYVESAEIWASYGDADEAQRLLEVARQGASTNSVALNDLVPVVRVLILSRSGKLREARAIQAAEAVPRFRTSPGEHARWVLYGAFLSVLESSPDAGLKVREAMELARRQGLGLHLGSLRVLQAVLAEGGLDGLLQPILREDPAFVSLMAEAVVPRLLDLADSTFDLLSAEVQRRPGRWRGPLRHALTNPSPRSIRAADLLELIGTPVDVSLLRSVAKALRRRGVGARLGRGLARRLAPKVFLEDQGRLQVRVGGALLPYLEVRRKVLSLMCFLVTRPEYAATRDEVVDALWPDVEPVSGVNSLNQTLYFLRRVLEPDYSDDLSANYVHHDSDVVWLDQELVTSRSGLCRALIAKAGDGYSRATVLALSREYRAKFALDFAYEPWVESFRDNLHAAYLEVIERAVPEVISRGEPSLAIVLARRALDIDPDSEQLERLLLIAYHASGAHAAVGEQYSHYASLMRDGLGVEPPPLDQLIERQFDVQ